MSTPKEDNLVTTNIAAFDDVLDRAKSLYLGDSITSTTPAIDLGGGMYCALEDRKRLIEMCQGLSVELGELQMRLDCISKHVADWANLRIV